MPWECTCNGLCYGYVACSCNSTAYSCTCHDAIYNCTCYNLCYGQVCGCYSSCYNQGCTSDSCDCYTYWYCPTCNYTVYSCGCYSTAYSCTCHDLCYGYVACSCNYVQYITLTVTDGFKEGDARILDATALKTDGFKEGDAKLFDITTLLNDGYEMSEPAGLLLEMTFQDIYTMSEPERPTFSGTIVREDTVKFSEYSPIKTFKIWMEKTIQTTQWVIKEGAPLGYWFARKWLQENWFMGLAMNLWDSVSKKVTNWTKRPKIGA